MSQFAEQEGEPKQSMAVSLSSKDRVDNSRRPMWLKFTGQNTREGELQREPQRSAKSSLKSSLRTDQCTSMRKLSKAKERTTGKKQAEEFPLHAQAENKQVMFPTVRIKKSHNKWEIGLRTQKNIASVAGPN